MSKKEVTISEALGYTPGLVCLCGSDKVVSYSDFDLTSPFPKNWKYTILCDTCGRKTGPGESLAAITPNWKKKEDKNGGL